MEATSTALGAVAWYEWVLIAGGVLTASGAFWVKIIVPVYNLIKTVESFYPIVPTITAVAKELEFNTIASIKTDVSDIKDELQIVSEDLKEFKEGTQKDIGGIEVSLEFLNKHSIRTREGNIYETPMENRKKYFGFINRNRRRRP